MRNILKHYSRLLIVRVDLGYSKDTSHLISIKDFHQHIKILRKLFARDDTKKPFWEGVEGFVIALEQGHDRGYHCHLLVMFDGAKKQDDTYLGQAIGEKWKVITNGLGSYYNCNNLQYKQKYKDAGTLGIGMIHRQNSVEVENAVRVALYLTEPDKENQHLRIKTNKMKTFTHSTYKVRKRRGLPK